MTPRTGRAVGTERGSSTPRYRPWRRWWPGHGGRFGSLLLGAYDAAHGDLVYIGDVGTGWSERERAQLQQRLDGLHRDTSPFTGARSRAGGRGVVWVEPPLVGEVKYRQFTDGRLLRHTSWRRVRDDREPLEVILPGPAPGGRNRRAPAATPGTRVTVSAGKRTLTLSNLDKPLYPDGFTKGQVLEYYSRMAEVLLPLLRDRPVTFVRYPDGVGSGPQVFAKNVTAGAPDWVRTVTLPRAGSRGEREAITYPLLDELAGLVWAANLAALELHVPQWTVTRDGKRRVPDRLVFDLDPGPRATVVACCRVAEQLHDLLIADGLTPVATTSAPRGCRYTPGSAPAAPTPPPPTPRRWPSSSPPRPRRW